MILTDSSGRKYWAHFRHVLDDLEATSMLTDPETGGPIRIPTSFLKAQVELIAKAPPRRMSGRFDDGIPKLMIRRTECAFHEGNCKKPGKPPCDTPNMVNAFALCSPKEFRFDRNEGRKEALKKAMKHLPRALRAELWDSYFNGAASRAKFEPYRKPPITKRVVH